MKLDPKLLRLLEEREDANDVIAEALGVCPTCGRELTAPLVTVERGEKKARIIEWRRLNPGNNNQSLCARETGCSVAYVGRIWQEQGSNLPRDEASE